MILTPTHPRRRRWWLPIGVLFVLMILLIGAYTRFRAATPAPIAPAVPDKGTLIDPPRQLTDWTLTSHTGKPLSLHDFRGRTMLLFFGYTHCPDVCPTTLGDWKAVKRELGTAAQAVAFVFISVDGERDTPEQLARYVTTFDPDFIGLSGTATTLAPIAPDYGLYYKKRDDIKTQSGYFVDHTAATYLIDAEGRLRVLYPYGIDPRVIAADIQQLVAQ